MKDDLVGRVAGYSSYLKTVPADSRDPEGPTRDMTTTRWVRVTGEHRNDPELVIARNIHTGVHGLVARRELHTILPKAY